MDFICRAEFEGVKSCFGSCNANFFYWFSSGSSEDHMARASSATAQVVTP